MDYVSRSPCIGPPRRAYLACVFLTCWPAIVSGQLPVPPLDIRLGREASEDPRIDYLLPAPNSPDRLDFLPDGLRLALAAQGRPDDPSVGLVLKAGSPSRFTLLLEFECQRWDPPQARGGRLSSNGPGLLIKALMDDPAAPEIVVGYVVTPKKLTGLEMGLPLEASSPPPEILPLDFRRGAWLLQREDSALIVSVSESGESFRRIATMPCSSAAVREFQVLATRQGFRNASLELLLKRIVFAGDEYFSQAPPRAPFWKTRLGLILMFGTVLALAVGITAWTILARGATGR